MSRENRVVDGGEKTKGERFRGRGGQRSKER